MRRDSPEYQADEGNRGQGLEERVEQVFSVKLPSHDLRVRVSGGLCLPITVHFTR